MPAGVFYTGLKSVAVGRPPIKVTVGTIVVGIDSGSIVILSFLVNNAP
jgi:hypothetical protein